MAQGSASEPLEPGSSRRLLRPGYSALPSPATPPTQRTAPPGHAATEGEEEAEEEEEEKGGRAAWGEAGSEEERERARAPSAVGALRIPGSGKEQMGPGGGAVG